MGQPRSHLSLGGSFERTYRLSQSPRALQCPSKVQRKLQAGYVGHNPKESIQVAPRRKEIACDQLPNPGIGKLRFQLEQPLGRLARQLERACRLSQSPRTLQCASKLQRTFQAGFMGHKPKASILVAPRRKDIAYDQRPNPGIGKPRF